MTANWFEAKVKYIKVNEDGREKKVTESYLLDAMSYTEAESRIMKEMESVIKGEYYINGLKKSNITELVESVDENDEVMGYAFCMFQHHSNDNILTDIKTMYIDDLCVDEKIRGKHIGKGLYERVLEFAKEQGCYNVTLNVWSCNEAAMKFL